MPTQSVVTLLAYIVIMVPGMLLGFYFARRKMFFPNHKYVMTGVTIMNWIFILVVMFASYRDGVLPGVPASLSDIRILLPTLHLLTGGIAQLLATYLVILMWTERTRFERLVPIRIKKIKTPMRLTLGLWLTTVALGIAIFAVWYAIPSNEATVEPIATEEATPATDNADPAVTESAESAEPSATESAETSESESESEPAATEASGS